MSTNFSGSPLRWVLLHLPVLCCISHMMKYTVGWESYGEKSPILWEKYEYQFPRFTPYEGFCCISPYYEKMMGKPMHFPYDEVCHRMGIGWEKSTHTMGKVWLSVSQTYPISWVLLYWSQYAFSWTTPRPSLSVGTL